MINCKNYQRLESNSNDIRTKFEIDKYVKVTFKKGKLKALSSITTIK